MSLPVDAALSRAGEALARYDCPRLEAEVLLAHVLDCSRGRLYARGDHVLSDGGETDSRSSA